MECKITLRSDSYHNTSSANKSAKLAQYAIISGSMEPGDIVEDIKIDFGWSHKNPKSVNLELNHVQFLGRALVDTGNQLWAEDVRSPWEKFIPGVKTEVIKKELVSFSGVGPLSEEQARIMNSMGEFLYRFNGLNKVISVPRSWCNETAQHYVNIYPLPGAFSIPPTITFNVLRAKNPGDPVSAWVPFPVVFMDLLEAMQHSPVIVPYDIVKEIGIDVPPVVDFGRVDTGVVAKQNIDVRLTYVGIPGRGLLTFSYAGAQNMEVTVREKSESQDTPLPYHKYIEQLPQDTMSLSYQIGVKGHIARDTEQLVLVTFHVY
ncbi:hypothetical protein DN242_19400 [Salmonella enterica subsp. enterica serovar Reading]|nr:hypothetical protein [Salmonella enterica subsp. enterica serovar Reading]EBW4794882.1 hypothetical protein [Salmonella enterica subsp. enterica serovar Reading]